MFNTCLDPTSVSDQNVLLLRGVQLVPGRVTYEAAEAAVVFTPNAPLQPASTYQLAILEGIRTREGQAQKLPFALTFLTRSAPETSPPSTSAAPSGGSYNAPQQVTLTCSDGAGGSGCLATYFTVDGSPPGPTSAAYKTPISITTSTTLKFHSVDGDGNVEPAKTETYVLDVIPPGVVSTQPASGETSVRLDTAALKVVFSEPMRPGSLDGGAGVQPAAPSTSSYDAATRTLQLALTEPLECATSYAVTIAASASDLAGNTMSAPHSWTFTTASDCDEPRTAASLSSGAYTSPQSVTLSCSDGDGGTGCARIGYTTDGTAPTFAPPNGTILSAASAGPISIGFGETALRFRAQDVAGNVETIRERRYSISNSGFTFVASGSGLARGVGPKPARFTLLESMGSTTHFFRDPVGGRLYRVSAFRLGFIEDGSGAGSISLPLSGAGTPQRVAAVGSRLYVGTSDGLLISTNGGQSFVLRALGSFDANRVTALEASGADLYVGTDEGLVISNDRFRTWRRVSTRRVVGIARQASTVYVAHLDGTVTVSNDRGLTWSAPVAAGGGPAYAVAAAQDAVFVGTSGGLAISQNRGASFAILRTSASGLSADPVFAVAAAGGYVYAATGFSYSSAPSAFFVSANGGTTFARKFIPGGTRDASVYSLFAEGSTLHVGGYPSYWRSTNNGATFTLADLPGNSFSGLTGAGSTLYVAFDKSSQWGGVVASNDSFNSFRFLTSEQGLPDTKIDDLFLDGATLYLGTWRGLAITTNGGATFNVRTEANSGLFSSAAATVRATGTTVWVAGSSRLQRSTNGGQSFGAVVSALGTAKALELGSTTVALATGDGLEVSTNSGASFAHRTTTNGLSSDNLDDVAITGSGRIFVVSTAGADMSTNAGATFSPVVFAAGFFPRFVEAAGSLVYFGDATRLAVSDDEGATFTYRGAAEGVPSGLSSAKYLPP